jgi:hypothetical protein
MDNPNHASARFLDPLKRTRNPKLARIWAGGVRRLKGQLHPFDRQATLADHDTRMRRQDQSHVLRLPQPHTWAAAVPFNELHTGQLQGVTYVRQSAGAGRCVAAFQSDDRSFWNAADLGKVLL